MVSRSLCPDFVGSVFSYAPDSQSVNFISQAEVSQCFKVLNVRFCCFSLSLTKIIRVFGFWTDFWMMASCSRIHKMKKVSFVLTVALEERPQACEIKCIQPWDSDFERCYVKFWRRCRFSPPDVAKISPINWGEACCAFCTYIWPLSLPTD